MSGIMRLLAVGLFSCALCVPSARAGDVLIFAAASLGSLLDALAPKISEATGHEVSISYAGSSVLARQIAQGAPADIFISANRAWMDRLEADGALLPGSRADLLANRLVLVAHEPHHAEVALEPGVDLAQVTTGARIAMALVEAVPAGIYGKAALTYLGQWEALAPQVVQTDNVRTALALVARGEAPYGIVYATDACAEPRVHAIGLFPAQSHPAIRYPVARTVGSTPAAGAVLEFLHGDTARTVFEAAGFSMATE